MKLIEEFKAGRLPLAEGTTLRDFLCKTLRCAPVRLSNRFRGVEVLGRTFYRYNGFRGCDAAVRSPEVTAMEGEMKRLEEAFLAAKKKRDGSSAAANGDEKGKGSKKSSEAISSKVGGKRKRGEKNSKRSTTKVYKQTASERSEVSATSSDVTESVILGSSSSGGPAFSLPSWSPVVGRSSSIRTSQSPSASTTTRTARRYLVASSRYREAAASSLLSQADDQGRAGHGRRRNQKGEVEQAKKQAAAQNWLASLPWLSSSDPSHCIKDDQGSPVPPVVHDGGVRHPSVIVDKRNPFGRGLVERGPIVTWETRFKELVQYKAKHGDCSVPDGQGKLGNWVRSQRKACKAGSIAQDRLSGIGFKWSIRQRRPGSASSRTGLARLSESATMQTAAAAQHQWAGSTAARISPDLLACEGE